MMIEKEGFSSLKLFVSMTTTFLCFKNSVVISPLKMARFYISCIDNILGSPERSLGRAFVLPPASALASASASAAAAALAKC